MLKDDCFQLLLLRVVLHKFPSMCSVLWWLSRREIAAKPFSRKKNKAGGITPCLHTIPQSCSNQNSMALAQKQMHRLMEQNTAPRNKPTLT